MYIYKINLTKTYYNLKYCWTTLHCDAYLAAIIIAENNKVCREVAFNELKGAETTLNLVNKRKPKNISKFDWNNEIWKNSKYSSCKKIGVPMKNSKRGIVMVNSQMC